jgi:ATP-dependent DNA ligase
MSGTKAATWTKFSCFDEVKRGVTGELQPKLVIEIYYDHVTGNRLRHGTKLLRWRPDKSPEQCTMH